MKYRPLSNSFYNNSRKAFMAELKPKSLAVFNSNDIYPVGADSTLPFEQHRDIFISLELIKKRVYLYSFQMLMKKNKERSFLFVKQMSILQYGKELNSPKLKLKI